MDKHLNLRKIEVKNLSIYGGIIFVGNKVNCSLESIVVDSEIEF